MDKRLVEAAELADNGQIGAAHAIVLELVENDEKNFDAWFALVQLAKNDFERRTAIYKMWGLRPNDPDANLLLDKLKAGSLPPLDNEQTDFSSRKYKAKDGLDLETKDYFHAALVTAFCYIFLWVVGFVVNIYYLQNAYKYQSQLGFKAQNKGCLWATLIFGLIVSSILSVALFSLLSVTNVI